MWRTEHKCSLTCNFRMWAYRCTRSWFFWSVRDSLLLHAQVREYLVCHSLVNSWLDWNDHRNHPDSGTIVGIYVTNVLIPLGAFNLIPQASFKSFICSKYASGWKEHFQTVQSPWTALTRMSNNTKHALFQGKSHIFQAMNRQTCDVKWASCKGYMPWKVNDIEEREGEKEGQCPLWAPSVCSPQMVWECACVRACMCVWTEWT